jgi:hypothetical protein
MPFDERGLGLPARSAAVDSVDSLLREAANVLERSSSSVQFGLLPGDLLAERFVIERRAGSGGMGTIYRARDLRTQETVAIKVMASGHDANANRFARESVMLAELSHGSIVRYVAHGTTPEGTAFLAMEWLEGEDLAQRLARSPLTVEESLRLMRRACEGVAAAHARGVVHRDVKPSNLFLVDRDPSLLKVLDFGIARQSEGALTLTQSGAMLGTVGYMSPEQAMGPREVDATTDVFSLGCVLFECLTGRAAFTGPNAVAVLAKVLREDPPRVSELRPGLGAGMDVLVAQLLAKDPDERPKDAMAVLHALDELERGGAPSSLSMTAGLTAAEQKIVSVILGELRRREAAPAALREPDDGDVRRLEELAHRFGAEPTAMCGGGLLIVLSGRGAATDQASQAVKYGLLLSGLRPELRFAVGTGRAETTGHVPVGAAIDRAAALLDGSDDPGPGVAVDTLTAGLLEPGFDLRRDGERLFVAGERDDLEATRLFMGKPTPFVGRDKELRLLELTLRECVEESVARAVLVTGPPGQGKSRLRREFVARARERGDARILIARADPVGAGSAFLLVRQLVRHATGVREGDPEQQASLRAYVTGICERENAERIADFLGELLGASPPERPSLELRAARHDPNIMSVWLRRSFGEWLAAESAATPLVLVLEDLHWGDIPSVTYLGEALRALSTRPLMVLALARPEVHEGFPSLWTGAEKQEIALGRLAPRAAERLVREAVGAELRADAVAGIVERADGNPFYLEELIRRVATGDSETLPETVLALVQSRLERFEPELRRIIRAASIFGEVFWEGGIAALIGSNAPELGARLESLVVNEVLVPSHDSRILDEREYAFRHGLLREAAYAMLTDAERARGHRLAGEWLERAGEKDALTLADHHELGGERERAVRWLVQAARAAIDGGNLHATLAIGDRAISCGAKGDQRGALGWLRGAALAQAGDLEASVEAGRDAMGLLPTGSPLWLLSASTVFLAGVFLGDRSITTPVLQAVLNVEVQPAPYGAYGSAMCHMFIGLSAIGEHDLATAVLERAEVARKSASFEDPSFVACMRIAKSDAHLMNGELASAFACVSETRRLSDRIGHATVQAQSRVLLVGAHVEAGSWERAEESARELFSFCESRGSHFYSDRCAGFLATARLDARRVQDAIALFRSLIDKPDRLLGITARARLAHALVAADDLDSAMQEASRALAEGSWYPSTQPTALGALALIAMLRHDPADAFRLGERGLAVGSRGIWLRDGSILRLVRAEALHALGRREEAHAAIRDARDRVLGVVATLDDPELRHSYVTGVGANARTLRLAGEWLTQDAS